MKKFFSLSSLCLLILLSACGSGNKDHENGGGSDIQEEGTSGNLSMEKANEIIEYHNDVLAVFRRLYEDDNQEKVLKYMAERKGRIGSGPVITQSIGYRDTSKIVSPGNYFDKDVRENLKKDINSFLRAGEAFYQNFTTYKSYAKAEDYKDDNWAKGNQLLEENKKLAEEISVARERVYSVISPLANQAELITLKDNPWKENIILSKQIFASMEGIMEEYAEEKVNPEKIDTQYNNLEKQVEEARTLPTVSGQERKGESFTKFITQVDEFMGEVRKAKREGKYDDRGYRKLTSEYNKAINRYNNFVN
ncbi:MAG: YiiG family protein [Candidatus Azobacteroides sp.]|nr:YiiG family protein [Candidatus Azobacteroides sp.]